MLNVNQPQTAPLPGLRPTAPAQRPGNGLSMPIDQFTLGGFMDAPPAAAAGSAAAPPAPAPAATPAVGTPHLENYIPDKEKCRMVETKSTIADLESLGRSYRLSHNVLMIGTTGAGKTSRVKYLAALLKQELRRINLSDMTDVTEIIGGYKPGPNGGFEWHDGIVTEAVRKGQWLLLDEINLADPAILERLNPLLDSGRLLVLNEKENEVVHAHQKTRIFATMNPSSYSGRKELSEAMLNRFKRLYVFPPEADELAQIAQGVLPHWTTEAVPLQKIMKDGSIQNISNLNANTQCSLLGQRKELNKVVYAKVRTADGSEGWVQDDKLRPDIPQKKLLQMVTFHDTVAKMADQRQIGKRDGPYPYTLRDLLKWVDRIEQLKDDSGLTQDQLIYREAKDLYLDRLQNPEDRKAVAEVLRAQVGDGGYQDPTDLKVEKPDALHLKIGDITLPITPGTGELVPGEEADLLPIQTTMKTMYRLAKAVQVNEPMLLVGATSAGKTSMVEWMSRLTNNNFMRFNLSGQTDTSDFIGGYISRPKLELRVLADSTITDQPGSGNTVANVARNTTVKVTGEKQEVNGRLYSKVASRDGKSTGWMLDDDLEAKRNEFAWKDGILTYAMRPRTLSAVDIESEPGNGNKIGHVEENVKLNYLGEQKTVNGKLYSHVATLDGNTDGWVDDSNLKADWVVFDEINLASPSVLERINSLLDDDRNLTLSEKNNEIIYAHPSFRTFGTMNPATAQYGGRKELSLAMRNRFTEVWVDEVTNHDELLAVTKFFMRKVDGGDALAEKMVAFHEAFCQKIDSREIGQMVKEGKKYTLRNLQAFSQYMKTFIKEDGPVKTFLGGAKYTYAEQFPDPADRVAISNLAESFKPTP